MTTIATSTEYDQLIKKTKEANSLGSTISLLHWDQEVMMPKKGIEYRADQISLASRMHHELSTDQEVGDLLSACESDSDLVSDSTSMSAVNIREIRHKYNRLSKLPSSLVEEEAMLSSLGQNAWAEARKNNDFSEFQPWLVKIVDLLRSKADCYGWKEGGEPWDALAEDYEPGCTATSVSNVFTPLRERLQSLLNEIMGSETRPSNSFNEIALPVEQQKSFVKMIATQIGFDFEAGRLDESTHPFCSGTHCNDVRLTTRFHENNVNDAIGSTMHEAGHGIYEQGLLFKHVGTPMGNAVSLGIHESQSRMWENQVGRSEAFWKWCYPKMNEFFGDATASLTFDDVYGGANIVKPDFIRVEADEATYNMHIMIRFELERMMMKGDLAVADLPEAWNSRYKEYLGIDVPSDTKGCLQDIHWSMTSMGYFPTYTLGNLYCAQFFETAMEEIPDMHEQFARGEFSALKTWLNENIHQRGQQYRAAELCEVVTGKALSADPLMRHLESKLKPLYDLT
ncbi:MAG: carboxypeptidase M32 [Phycisphaerales bacterium]|jgi:carboxypeptidase Taq|nr:carboxypeptidase M32 [Phycisphaerales bacterium]